MATFEQVGIMSQINDQTYRLVRNIRSNASDYSARATAGQDPVLIGTVMKADADRFIARVGQLTSLAQRNLTLFTNALAIFGLTVADAVDLRDQVLASLNHTNAATLGTKQQILDESALILASVPNFDGLY